MSIVIDLSTHQDLFNNACDKGNIELMSSLLLNFDVDINNETTLKNVCLNSIEKYCESMKIPSLDSIAVNNMNVIEFFLANSKIDLKKLFYCAIEVGSLNLINLLLKDPRIINFDDSIYDNALLINSKNLNKLSDDINQSSNLTVPFNTKYVIKPMNENSTYHV